MHSMDIPPKLRYFQYYFAFSFRLPFGCQDIIMSFEKELRGKFPDIVFAKLPSPSEHPRWIDHGFQPGRQILPKGHVRVEGHRPFEIAVIMDRDIRVTLRDGVNIYVDLFRPADSDTGKEPVIIAWSPYGKTGTGTQNPPSLPAVWACLLIENFRVFECRTYSAFFMRSYAIKALDPADWCERGYAILQVDARGAGHSEGNISWWGTQVSINVVRLSIPMDIYDYNPARLWREASNTDGSRRGNSWLAVSQVNFAARFSHPALKAIAPWEGKIDLYRDQLGRGGKPHIKQFHQMLLKGFAGRSLSRRIGPGYVEDIWEMIQKRPLFDDYWETKRVPVENIDVPTYVVASFASMLHVKGSFQTFRTAKTSHKWLRVHPYFEWYDLYRKDVNDDLQRFFDHYCKGLDNAWENTPPVRLSLIGFHNSPARTVIERPENEFPLARQQLRKLYLDTKSRTLQWDPVTSEDTASYEGHSLGDTVVSRTQSPPLFHSCNFVVHFRQATEIAGYSKVVLFMSCKEHDDMDVAVQIRKIDAHGQLLEHVNYPCPVPYEDLPHVNITKQLGPQGFLRASHSISREGEDVPNDVSYSHRKTAPIEPGTIVKLEIPLWPMGMVFAPGEGIMLRVSGHDMCHPETEGCRILAPEDDNVGMHNIHSGGQYDSFLVLPFIPAKA
ncbi:Transposase [Fusarium oxysporum f. sp. albedinis]|nr:Uncharacterized protein HZ326_25392 [Fusarium oxysporum f. sp. albedinis]KAJ0131872.1 Transposase [Fusarium oxysporum f. sp. albedinis]